MVEAHRKMIAMSDSSNGAKKRGTGGMNTAVKRQLELEIKSLHNARGQETIVDSCEIAKVFCPPRGI